MIFHRKNTKQKWNDYNQDKSTENVKDTYDNFSNFK